MALPYYSNGVRCHSGYSWYYFPVVSGSATNLVLKINITVDRFITIKESLDFSFILQAIIMSEIVKQPELETCCLQIVIHLAAV